MAWLALVVSACAEAPRFEPNMISLTPTNRTARLVLPADHEGRALLEIVRVDNPEQHPAMISVRVPGQQQPLHRISLYPPDQPARIALRVPRQSREVIVELEKLGPTSPPAIMLRIGQWPK